MGQSKNMHERRISHLKRLRGERHLKSFSEWFVTVGKNEERIEFRVLCRCVNDDTLKNKLEIFWFNELHPRFYGSIPSINNKWSHSKETRKKISDSLQCEPHRYKCEMCGARFESHRKRAYKRHFCSSKCYYRYNLSTKRDKITRDEVVRLYDSGMTQIELSEKFGVSAATISRFMRDNDISTGYKRHKPGLKRGSRKTDNVDVV